jgi:hypothetical protein
MQTCTKSHTCDFPYQFTSVPAALNFLFARPSSIQLIANTLIRFFARSFAHNFLTHPFIDPLDGYISESIHFLVCTKLHLT